MILLEVRVWRWTLRALEHIQMGHAGNTLRGALGYALADTPDYAVWFRPEMPADSGPSGFADAPRPFVIRASHLNGMLIEPGATFHFDIHSFETRADRFPLIREAVGSAALAGFGPTGGRAELQPTQPEAPIRISFDALAEPVQRMRVRYLTPTELKGGALDDFGVLFARVRDRVASLRGLYGAGPLEIDFREIGQRAQAVRTVASRLQAHDSTRTSSRTGQTHTLGGQTGDVEFEGDLREFWPWLEAAQWTGVGRQTVWGKGAIRIDRSPD